MFPRQRLVSSQARPTPILAAFLGCLALSCGYERSAADTFTWTGASPNIPGFADDWSNPFNWQDGAIPVNDGTAEVIIPNTPRDNPDVDMPWSIDSLTFDGSGNYSLNEDLLTVDDITHNGTGTVTFNNSLGVSGTNAVWRAASGPMTFNGAITGTNILVLEAPQPITFDGAAANTLTGTVAVIEGTLVLSKSSSNATIAGSLSIIDATARWDAPNQVSDLMTSQVNVSNGGLADLAGNSETLSQLSLLGGSRLQSTSGVFTATTQIALQDSSEIDLGSGELMLQASVFRTGNSSATSRIDAALITLDQTQTIVSVADSPAAVELQIDAPIQSTVFNNSLEKQGGGALRLTGASSYLHTIVAGGTLIVDNDSGSGTGTGQVSVRTGSMLTGDGSLSGTVAMLNGATISPSASSGFPIGSLTVGILNMNAGSVFKVEFNDALPVTLQRDVLTVTGFATLGGILELENLNATNLPEPTDAYTILTTGTGDLNGSFANVANGERLGAIDGSGSFVVNYGADSPFDPNHVVLSDFLAAGDFDGDGDVDGSDFLTWQRTFGAPASPPGSGADGDGDGTVDGDDLAMWADNFGDPGPATASQSPAPEPASCVIMLAFATCLRRAPHFRRGTASAVRGRHRRPH